MRKVFARLRHPSRNLVVAAVFVLAVSSIAAFMVVCTQVLMRNRIYPNVYIGGLNVGLLTGDEALSEISSDHANKLLLTYADQEYELDLGDVGFSYKYQPTIEEALNAGKSGMFFDDIYLLGKSFIYPTYLDYKIEIDDNLSEYLSVVAGEIVEEPVYPSVEIVGNEVAVDPGESGISIDLERLEDTVVNQLKVRSFEPIQIHTIQTPTLTELEIDTVEDVGKALIGKSIIASYDRDSVTFTDKQLIESLLPHNGTDYLVTLVSAGVNRSPQNATLLFEGDKVKEFTPSKDGIEVIESDLKNKISDTLRDLMSGDEKSLAIEIPVRTTTPQITNESVNNLGIEKLLGKGSSAFVGSIPSRVHNIGVATSHFSGVLVEPGKVFSFNEIVGDISSLTGYQQAYVIQNGATVLGDGGGVCQVSTTLFRAALDAGLPIVERKPHSYRVAYYEQNSAPGLDATIYSPTTDLKIKNDTPAHILIQTYYNPVAKTLDFEIYGTPDGRKSTVSKPIITSSSPPPEDLYIDDPNLKVGEVKQIDWKAWGAKVQFDYKVERGGETIFEQTYYSNYRPWQAKFLRGTAPI